MPIFDIRVDMRDSELTFDPSIESNERSTGIRDIIQRIVDDFISLSIQMPRMDSTSGSGGDYLVEIKDQYLLFGAMQQISRNFNEIVGATNDFIAKYEDKEFLWKEVLSESFQAFLDSGDDPKE
jgi:hypothetical protein